ncbi:MAG: DUF2721 domain-containing protein [Psychrilyobacter sp.]|uniref:DUF2721 domain-containing protein n=1 Tax=Psychrilyobacter sp. TaxID=2586924 RepID=UPI003C787F9F
MQLTLTTPALIFSTISLLLLAYTSRFIALANLIRSLHNQASQELSRVDILMPQIENLKIRVKIIKNMQLIGIISLFFCVFSMFLIFLQQVILAEFTFAGSLILLMISLFLSAIEINISVKALNIELSQCVGDQCKLVK